MFAKDFALKGLRIILLQIKLLFGFGNPLHALFQEHVYLNTQICPGETECSGTLT